jgi:hypothetical protein
MSTVTRSRKRVKPERRIRLAVPPSEVNPFAVVVITVGKEAASYRVQVIPSDFGDAFQVEKLDPADPEVYHVNLSAEGRTCDCKGFCRWNHCKHADGLAALRSRGLLPVPRSAGDLAANDPESYDRMQEDWSDYPAPEPMTEAEMDAMAASYGQ